MMNQNLPSVPWILLLGPCSLELTSLPIVQPSAVLCQIPIPEHSSAFLPALETCWHPLKSLGTRDSWGSALRLQFMVLQTVSSFANYMQLCASTCVVVQSVNSEKVVAPHLFSGGHRRLGGLNDLLEFMQIMFPRQDLSPGFRTQIQCCLIYLGCSLGSELSLIKAMKLTVLSGSHSDSLELLTLFPGPGF